MDGPGYRSIGEVLSLLKPEFADLTISKIRFLESQGLLDPERTPSGYRKFYDTDVERLRWILQQQHENYLPLKVIKGKLGSDADDDDSLVGTPHSDVRLDMDKPANDDGAPPSEPPRRSPPTIPGTDSPPQVAGEGASQRIAGNGPLGQASDARPTPTDAVASWVPSERPSPPIPVDRTTSPVPSGPTTPAAVGRPENSLQSGAAGPVPLGQAAGSVRSDTISQVSGGQPRIPAPRRPIEDPVTRRGVGHQSEDLDRRQATLGTSSSPPTTGLGSSPSPGAGSPRKRSGANPARLGSGVSRQALAARDRGAAPVEPPSTMSLTLEELAAKTGNTRAELIELEQFGLMAGKSVDGVVYYDAEALTLANLAAGFLRYGVGARHLRMYRTSAEREATFFEQVVTPMLKQRNPQARKQAIDALEELSNLGEGLRASLLRQALRGHTGP